MAFRNPYPHGADLSVYPTVAVMREAYLFGFYRSYPHQAHVRIGPVVVRNWLNPEAERKVLAEMRPTCHAVIVLPRKVVLLRFARRATVRDIERLEYERTLLRQTDELAAVRHWCIEARLVHCDISDGVEAEARARRIRLALYRPRWLAAHRPRNMPAPSHGIMARCFDAARLAQFAAAHGTDAGSKVNRKRSAALWCGITEEQGSELARFLKAARWSKYRATQPGTPRE